jgi:hypothetical protein
VTWEGDLDEMWRTRSGQVQPDRFPCNAGAASRYEIGRSESLGRFRSLLAVRELRFEDEAAFEEALFHWRGAACLDSSARSRYR